MRIGIFTFHCAANYGAVLQTYALQEYLINLGHTVRIIDYRPDYLLKPYKSFRWTIHPGNSLYGRMKNLLRACFIFPIRRKRNQRFWHFINSYLHLYKLDLDGSNNDFDAFLFGSDQIWNPVITRGFDSIFLGDCQAVMDKKKVAYAASAGSVNNLGASELAELQMCLTKFDSISVREQTLQTLLKEEIHIDAELVLDPVLLVGKSVFEHIAVDLPQRKPYLLLFQLGKNVAVSQYAKNIAKQRGLNYVEIVSFTDSIKERHLKQTLSPEVFLGYIKNATCVMTPSFHGTAFSVLFEKDFFTIRTDTDIDERANQLLILLGLENRIHSLGYKGEVTAIDYAVVNNKLEYFRKRSIDYLNFALKM